jgi:uncharacterized protein YuzB (UPF0349 family)
VFDKAAGKVIKDASNTPALSLLPYTTLMYCTICCNIFLYLMTIFYLITTIVVLLAGDQVANKVTSGTKHLPDQAAATSREG